MILLTLTLIILFNVGKAFYNLAKKYNKNKSLYAFVGIVAFLLISSLFFFPAYYVIKILHWPFSYTIVYVSFTLGVILTVVVHYLLEKSWKKNNNVDLKQEIEKIGKKSNIDK